MKRLKRVRTTAAVFTAVIAASAILGGCGGNKDASEKDKDGVQKVTLAVAEGYVPFAYYDENENLTGYDMELAKEIFSRLPQYDLEFEVTEWDSVLTGLDSGKYDLTGGNILYTEERAEKYYYSNPIFHNNVILVVAEDNDSIHSFEDCIGKKTRVGAGQVQAQSLEAWNEEHPDQEILLDYAAAADQQTGMIQIVDGKYDFSIYDEMGFVSFKERFPDIRVKEVQLSPEDQKKFVANTNNYFMFSKTDDSKQLMDDVNEALAKVIEDETALELSEKFAGGDYIPREE